MRVIERGIYKFSAIYTPHWQTGARVHARAHMY